jgi:hypothetical protein
LTPSKLHAFTNPPRGRLSDPARASDAAPNTIRTTATDETKAFLTAHESLPSASPTCTVPGWTSDELTFVNTGHGVTVQSCLNDIDGVIAQNVQQAVIHDRDGNLKVFY